MVRLSRLTHLMRHESEASLFQSAKLKAKHLSWANSFTKNIKQQEMFLPLIKCSYKPTHFVHWTRNHEKGTCLQI